jgi:hypothetical protein
MKRPHEDPACKCAACEAYDNRGSDANTAEFVLRGKRGCLKQINPGHYLVLWAAEIEEP